MRRYDMIEVYSVAICMTFAVAISLYHVSFDGYLGLSDKFWGAVWAISENGFAMFLCILISTYFSGTIQKIFRYVFVPYFALKLIYHFSCYSGIYITSERAWESLWIVVVVLLFVVSLIYCLFLIRRNHA